MKAGRSLRTARTGCAGGCQPGRRKISPPSPAERRPAPRPRPVRSRRRARCAPESLPLLVKLAVSGVTGNRRSPRLPYRTRRAARGQSLQASPEPLLGSGRTGGATRGRGNDRQRSSKGLTQRPGSDSADCRRAISRSLGCSVISLAPMSAGPTAQRVHAGDRQARRHRTHRVDLLASILPAFQKPP